MQLSWTVMSAPGPIGALTVGATVDGLALVVFGDHPEAAVQAAERLGLAAVAEPVAAVAQLDEYLAGHRRVFDLPLDWSLTHGSQRRVLQTLYATVGFGDTVTYGELAARGKLGSAYTAARGVGAIMGSNPLPVVVPCHRVMAADGLGGFGGGRATKEWLLALEGVLTGALDFGD
jgi:methylated-DNA-[protein]-cysteine S-methyltransferase